MRCRMLFLLCCAICAPFQATAEEEGLITLGEPVPLKWDHGPKSFGMSLTGCVVPWSAPEAKDLMLSICWDGIYLLPTRQMADAELLVEPLDICRAFSVPTLAFAMDWNHHGLNDLIVADRQGYLYRMQRDGHFPKLTFNNAGQVKDHRSGLLLNIPFENPHLARVDDLGGYIDADFYNYTYPLVYPAQRHEVNLIIGDWAGNLWWLPDVSGGEGPVVYAGTTYAKSNGQEFSKPSGKICDTAGRPFLLGDGVDAGRSYHGANTRPAIYSSPVTGTADLLVLAGHIYQRLFYLKRVNSANESKPVFENLGEVRIDGMDVSRFGYHSSPILFDIEGWR